MIDLRSQLVLHLTSLQSAGMLYLPRPNVLPLNSAPAAVHTHQFRRCGTCKATGIFATSPSTALPCITEGCKGEMLVSVVSVDDLVTLHATHADALERLAAKCEENALADGRVSAKGAAAHMRKLAQWMREST